MVRVVVQSLESVLRLAPRWIHWQAWTCRLFSLATSPDRSWSPEERAGRTPSAHSLAFYLDNCPVLFLKWWSRWGPAPHKYGWKIHRSLMFHPSWHRAKDNKYLITPTANLKNQQLPKRRKLKNTHAIPQIRQCTITVPHWKTSSAKI